MLYDSFFAQMKGKVELAIYDSGIGIAVIASTVWIGNMRMHWE